jgi:protein dithiol oxidoreductase (disulfide-forming)
MERREFSGGATCLLGVATLSPAALRAQVKQPEEGTEYLALKRPVNVNVPPGNVEVIEFFWYSCPHCNAFEPRLEPWIKRLPSDVVMKRVPVAFNAGFVPQQRLFYTLEILGKLDELHEKVFHAIHVEHVPLNQDDPILDWVGKQGLDKAKFTEIYNSFDVVSKVRRAIQLQDAFKVQGVPSIGVQGRYYTDGTLAGNTERLLQVTDYLIAQARKPA